MPVEVPLMFVGVQHSPHAPDFTVVSKRAALYDQIIPLTGACT